MEIRQRRNSNRIRYVFGEDELQYDDEEGKRILSEIESLRAAQFKAEYDFMPDGDTPERLRSRFKWLHREGALTDEELKARLAMVDVTDLVSRPH